MHIIPLPYTEDSAVLFSKIADLPWPVFLDSCWPLSTYGRYDILSAKPYITLQTRQHETLIQHENLAHVSIQDPFALVKKYVQKAQNVKHEWPFSGGAIGYFSYDLERRLEKLPQLATRDIDLPEMAIGIYDWALIVDHHKQQTYLVSELLHTSTQELIPQILQRLQQAAQSRTEDFRLTTPFTSNMDQTSYAAKFKRIQDYIHAGDCYEINLTQRFQARFAGSTWQAYQTLRQQNPAPFSAYLRYPFATIMSHSPERFINVNQNLATTQPIKGTLPRNTDPQRDQQAAQALLHSEKNRAENLMIVDLMRNDFSKHCRTGSIKVLKLFALESFANVHHLVSTITGELAADKHSLDLLRGCFPGGSISGAPKIRALEIIEALEPQRRGIYCGSLGYINYQGDMDCNIAIRTLLVAQDRLFCATGGAITADSTLQDEYNEALAKVNIILDGLAAM